MATKSKAFRVKVTREEYAKLKLLKQPASVEQYEAIFGKDDPRPAAILSASFHDREIFCQLKR